MDINKILIFIVFLVIFLYYRKQFILKYDEKEFTKALFICSLAFIYIECIHQFGDLLVDFLNLVLG